MAQLEQPAPADGLGSRPARSLPGRPAQGPSPRRALALAAGLALLAAAVVATLSAPLTLGVELHRFALLGLLSAYALLPAAYAGARGLARPDGRAALWLACALVGLPLLAAGAIYQLDGSAFALVLAWGALLAVPAGLAGGRVGWALSLALLNLGLLMSWLAPLEVGPLWRPAALVALNAGWLAVARLRRARGGRPGAQWAGQAALALAWPQGWPGWAEPRAVAAAAALALGLAALGGYAALKEHQVATGRPILVPLAVESMTGVVRARHVNLKYTVVSRLTQREDDFYGWLYDLLVQPGRSYPLHGKLVFRTDEAGVVQDAWRHEPGEPLAAGELLVRYHRSGSRLVVGPERFRFRPEQNELFQAARYAELRVGPDGGVVLVGLRDAALRPLGPPLFP